MKEDVESQKQRSYTCNDTFRLERKEVIDKLLDTTKFIYEI